jgi:hypothetical protein
MMIKNESRAPRFRAYLAKKEGALLMQRTEWEKLVQGQDDLFEIDISRIPIASIQQQAEVVGTCAERSENGEFFVLLFREDPKDAPKHINLDKYRVWENLYPHIDYERTVIACDTCDDSDLRSFLDDYVIFVPKEKGGDHQLFEIPGRYKAILERKKAAG